MTLSKGGEALVKSVVLLHVANPERKGLNGKNPIANITIDISEQRIERNEGYDDNKRHMTETLPLFWQE